MAKEEFVIYFKCRKRKQTNLNLPKRACSGQTVSQCRYKQELVVSEVQLSCRLRQTAADNHYGSQPGSVLSARISWAQPNWLQSQVQLAPVTPCDHVQLSSELGYFVLADVSAHALLHWEILHSEDQSLKLRCFYWGHLGWLILCGEISAWDLYLSRCWERTCVCLWHLSLPHESHETQQWILFWNYKEITGYIATFCKLLDSMGWKQ